MISKLDNMPRTSRVVTGKKVKREMKGWETSTRAAAAPAEEDGKVEASCHCWMFSFVRQDKAQSHNWT
jgi:hypothetical protein